ncbi:MAG: imidazole glycerol phosphate synthase subunit HisH, partial [Planctomycetaceae bacterium]|nr:imidazole glycerol phosphate synthase subunit HisH [Planctomycetaceae bacterium]
MSSTVIVDYQMGNLRSVQKAFESFGEHAVISSRPQEIAAADRVVLPGVGAFRDAAAAIRHHDLTGVLKDHIAADRPFLGICLGLQLLFDVSYEDGEYEGLGIVPGAVRRFELPPEFKIPHMGWNQLQHADNSDSADIFQNIPAEAWFYFVHSYYVDPTDNSWVATTTDYGQPFVSVVARGNVVATQFHPEKSQRFGLKLLQN